MNQADMEKMMQQMNKVQRCMQKVDKSKLEQLEKRSNAFGTEVKILCDGGKRDDAQEKALSFTKEMMDSKEMKLLQKCAKMAEGMVQAMPFQPDIQDYKDKHVCDVL